MKVKIDTKKKVVTLHGAGNECTLLTLIAAFAGDAVILNSSQKSRFMRIITASALFDKITIDLKHENITKEFVQLMLRFN